VFKVRETTDANSHPATVLRQFLQSKGHANYFSTTGQVARKTGLRGTGTSIEIVSFSEFIPSYCSQISCTKLKSSHVGTFIFLCGIENALKRKDHRGMARDQAAKIRCDTTRLRLEQRVKNCTTTDRYHSRQFFGVATLT
jgi:hypothetical protein